MHRLSRTQSFVLIALLAIGSAAYFYFPFFPKARGLSIRLCVPHSLTSALPILADKEGFFKNAGLKAEIETAPEAKICLEQLIARQVDFAVSNVSPAVKAIIMANPLTVISELESSTHLAALVYWGEAGNPNPDSLIGKKIAVEQGTDAELLLWLFIKEHADLRLSNLHVVKTKSSAETVDLLDRGVVQGAVVPQPFLTPIEKSRKYVVEESAFFTSFSLLMGNADYENQNPMIIDKLVSALAQSQTYLENNSERARDIVMGALRDQNSATDPEIWPHLQFNLGLSSVLIAMMNTAKDSFTSTQDNIPAETSSINIFQSLYPQSLRKIKRERVTYE